MEEAAKKIQAFYRGHCTRKSLHWKLPSGRTLYEAFEAARRSALLSDIRTEPPVVLASAGHPPIIIPSLETKLQTSTKLDEPLQLKELNTENLKAAVEKSKGQDHSVSRHLNDSPVKDISSDEHGSTASLISEAFTISKNMQQKSENSNCKASIGVSRNTSDTGVCITFTLIGLLNIPHNKGELHQA